MSKKRKTLIEEDTLTDLDINSEKYSASLTELRCDGVDCIEPAQGMDHW